MHETPSLLALDIKFTTAQVRVRLGSEPNPLQGAHTFPPVGEAGEAGEDEA